jgi:hypothetical protein
MNRTGIILGVLALLGAGFGAGSLVQERGSTPLLRESERQRVLLEEKWNGSLKEIAGLHRSREESMEEAGRERQKAEQAGRELAALQARVKELETRRETAAQNPGKRKSTGLPFAQMLEDPQMKEFVKNQQLAMLDMQYGKLFERFKLSPEERQDLKGLLAEKMRRELDLGMAGMAGDPKKVADLAQCVKGVTEEMDAKIRTFLNNDEDYGVYKKWEETKSHRMQLNMLEPAFAGVGEPLSGEQEEQLVSVMQTAAGQRGSEGTADGFNAELLQGGFTPELGEKLLRNLDQQSARVLGDAAVFLSPAQLGALKQSQQNQRKMAELGMRMMAGGQK